MRLFVAEKPSLARAIADALPGPKEIAKSHIRCGNDVVAWCAGHILELADPEAYAPHYKHWRIEDLPILPREWKLQVSTRDLLEAIRSLLKSAERVVHAGDPDREGQLLVDEVLHFLGYAGPVERLLVRDLNPDAVRRQLGALEPNSRYRPLYESALARQRADWLFGMNMTRLYTLLGRAAGYEGVLSVGRVQTPLLGLIVARDRAIAEFQPAAYFIVAASIRTQKGGTFRSLWAPGLAAQPQLDEDKRLLSREVAERVVARVRGQRGAVTAHSQDKKSEAPPLSYALADLQMDAGKRLGMTAQAVLDSCQRLYEAHRLLTYPRSDCAYLPEAHHAQAREVLAGVSRQAPSFTTAIEKADLSRRSKTWNDKKVTAHHAIIPTPRASGDLAKLSPGDRALYELVAKRYLAQFYTPHEYLQSRLELDIAGEPFVATGRQVLALGWKQLFADVADDAEGVEREGDSKAPLPRLQPGDSVTAEDVSIANKRTQPPKAFTDASLIAAMCNVARFVRNPDLHKILTETDGIGTPATRASIIETLFARRYVTRIGKSIVSTATGRALIGVLPEIATTPDLTAVWEAAMRAITERRQSLDAFLTRISAQLRELVSQGRALGSIAVPAAATPGPRPRASKASPGPNKRGGARRHVRP